jgi:chemotaxis protein CheD
MGEVIKVGMADLNVCKTPDSLTTLGLGSCVGVAIYDKNTKITGLAHIMLPSSKEISNNSNIAKFADTGIEETVRLMKKMGADTSKLVAKIAGGAQMFAFSLKNNDMLNVGERNVNAVKEKLKELNIPIVAEDTGLNYGRTVIIDSNTGMYTIKAVGKPIKEI